MAALVRPLVGCGMGSQLRLFRFLESKLPLLLLQGEVQLSTFVFSQAFWGGIVASAGVGPNPIPQKSLTAENLADAISFCLTPSAATAAQYLARKMDRESGVRAAVDSFHAHLPRNEMQCDILPDQPAVWRIKRGKTTVRLSKLAACALVREGRLQRKHLQR